MISSINLNIMNLICFHKVFSISFLKILFFFLEKLIFLFPIVIFVFWFWKFSDSLINQRTFVLKSVIAILIALLISVVLKLIFYKNRPFIIISNENFLTHKKTSSFPSNHASFVFTVSFCFLFWFKKWISFFLFFLSFLVAWLRIFFGIHWPFDIVGSFVISLFSCFLSNLIWVNFVYKLLPLILIFYRNIFHFLIKKNIILK